MKRKKMTLAALLALTATAPAIVVPTVAPQAMAQGTPADELAVPKTNFAYDAINTLVRAGVIEGLPDGTYSGDKAMTRYEFAVAIARLLNRLPSGPGGEVTQAQLDAAVGPLRDRLTAVETKDTAQDAAIAELQARPLGVTLQQLNDAISGLRAEFAPELERLGVRVGTLEERVTTIENRVAAPPRLTTSFGILHRMGVANYISNDAGGRNIMRGNNGTTTNLDFPPSGGDGGGSSDDAGVRRTNKKYSYTDLELRLTDRVTDRLSATAALRSLGSTIEDPWTGDSDGGFYLREAYAVADLSDRSILSLKGLTAIIGRQHTKIGQGLLYDNDFAPTDQLHGMFRVGPVAFSAFIGSSNNQRFSGGSAGFDPYSASGAVAYLGGFPNNVFGHPGGSTVGFPASPVNAEAGALTEDNESLIHASFNLFRIAGNPVSIGITRELDGYQSQLGDSVDLTVPLFNRTVGFEYVRQRQYANGQDTEGSPSAYMVTVPVLRTNILDLNAAYGRAEDDFEYFVSSSANPFARTFGEALFDRPIMLGAPMLTGAAAGATNFPQYAAAKKGYDINGTLRIPVAFLRRIPLDFRYYKADATDGVPLGSVYSVGTTFNVTPGLDLEFKYGRYNPPGNVINNINYFRIGANLGF